MNTKKKRLKKSRFILVMIITFLSISNKYLDSIVYAEALPDVMSGSTTIADIVMTYMVSGGTFVANPQWITSLYNGLGESFGTIQSFVQDNLLTVDGSGKIVATQALEDAISQTNTYGALHLDTLFNVSATEAQLGGGVAATGAGTLAGALGGVATTGALPLAIGVTGAYWGGIGVGTLLAHAMGLYAKPAYYGLEVTTDQDYIDGIPAGGNSFQTRKWGSNDSYVFYSTAPGIVGVTYLNRVSEDVHEGEVYTCGFFNPTGSTLKYYNYDPGTGKWDTGRNVSGNDYITMSSYHGFTDGFTVVPKGTNIMSGIKGGTIKPKERYSPDLITADGNARGEYSEEEGYTIPNATPEVNPTGQSIVPGGASLQDWLRWANGAKGNNQQNDPDANADILQEILEAIRNNNPSPGINPDPDPDPDPNPNPTPTPTPVPKPDYDPDNPDQPEYDPKETENPDDITNGDPWTTPDLLDKFPFCLPRDVFRCFEKLDVNERMAPSISWHFVTPLGIHFDFDLDLEDYEGVASILRTLELIAFIIGLALATRNLIGR